MCKLLVDSILLLRSISKQIIDSKQSEDFLYIDRHYSLPEITKIRLNFL